VVPLGVIRIVEIRAVRDVEDIDMCLQRPIARQPDSITGSQIENAVVGSASAVWPPAFSTVIEFGFELVRCRCRQAAGRP